MSSLSTLRISGPAFAALLLGGCEMSQSEYVQEVCTRTVQSYMNAPSTFKVKRAYFRSPSTPQGEGEVLFEYEVKNALGVPLAGVSKCTFTLPCAEARSACVSTNIAIIDGAPVRGVEIRSTAVALDLDGRRWWERVMEWVGWR